MSPDPFAGFAVDPQTLNRYAYVINNPLRYVDPDGYQCQLADPDTGPAVCKDAMDDPANQFAQQAAGEAQQLRQNTHQPDPPPCVGDYQACTMHMSVPVCSSLWCRIKAFFRGSDSNGPSAGYLPPWLPSSRFFQNNPTGQFPPQKPYPRPTDTPNPTEPPEFQLPSPGVSLPESISPTPILPGAASEHTLIQSFLEDAGAVLEGFADAVMQFTDPIIMVRPPDSGGKTTNL